MQKLTSLIKQLGIQITKSSALPQTIKGFYYHDPQQDIIVINDCVETAGEFREVLAHELGHYFTYENSFCGSEFFNALQNQRSEFRATRWACDYLLPTDALLKIIENRVAYVPGAAFFPNSKLTNTMRLNFSNSSLDEIEKGIEIMGRILYKHLEGTTKTGSE